MSNASKLVFCMSRSEKGAHTGEKRQGNEKPLSFSWRNRNETNERSTKYNFNERQRENHFEKIQFDGNSVIRCDHWQMDRKIFSRSNVEQSCALPYVVVATTEMNSEAAFCLWLIAYLFGQSGLPVRLFVSCPYLCVLCESVWCIFGASF